MKDWFYLKKFELFNWWTFDWEIETFYLDDDVTVVSGDNWSWKSTVIDALVSLLVPNKIRKYNLSATDWSSKRSRSEITYIKWAYKNKETDDWVKTVFLRWNDVWVTTYSVILWYFRDESNGKEITLATFFRVGSTSVVDKTYVISEQELFIKNDFVNILNNKDLVSPVSKLSNFLKTKSSTKVYDKFSEYREDFSRFFWLKSNAIELFNKVVSLKEIKDLNSFFRENMLENNPLIMEEFLEIEKNYIWVKDIYEKIIASEKKLEILEPFMETKREYEKKEEEIKEISFFEENLGIYSNWIEFDLIKNELKNKKDYLETKNLDKNNLNSEIEKIWQEQKEIEFLIKNSSFSKRLDDLKNSLDNYTKEKNIRENNYINYTKYLVEAEIINNSWEQQDIAITQDWFDKNLVFIQEKNKNLEIERQENQRYILEKMSKQKEININLLEVKDNLEYFKSRENLLPKRLADIRKNLSKSLWIDENQLSFVCELIRVKESEKSFEMAIEKLLHSFGQEMLVNESILHKVNEFVDKNNLKWKLKYNKISNIDTFLDDDEKENILISKLEIKHSISSSNWLKEIISKRFDYICLQDVKNNLYYENSKVLTITGLIKNRDSYIKDDRDFDFRNYILGWDNKKKILELEKELSILQKNLDKINDEIKKAEKNTLSFDFIFTNLIKLESIKSFSQIDYISQQKEINKIKQEIKDLENSDTDVKRYSIKLQEITKKLQEKQDFIEKLYKEIWIIENTIKSLDLRELELVNLLFWKDFVTIKNSLDPSKYSFLEVSLENIIAKKEEKQELLRRKKEKLNEIKQTFTNKMNWFASSYRENRMEVSEKLEISSSISDPDFRKYLEKEYHKIKDEELYKYKQKFEKEFRETLFIRLNDFYMTLENEENHIKNKILEINSTLHNIAYTKETFIEINLKDNNKKLDWIEDFKRNFREKVINKRELDTEDKLKAFENIKTFMERMINKEQEDWRNSVIDVRNWFLFGVKEKYFSSLLVKDIYESSSWKSWWQTIKLAYWVLAAALLYQYGIKEEETSLFSSNFSKSFRLVVIDEVFAKLDIDNSRYVLDLFEKLWLQLFIITPTNTINVLEDYVKTIYFISNNTWEKSYKNKIDIISRKPLEEKIKEKQESLFENKFLKKEN